MFRNVDGSAAGVPVRLVGFWGSRNRPMAPADTEFCQAIIGENLFSRLEPIFSEDQIFAFACEFAAGNISRQHFDLINAIDKNGTISYDQAYAYCDHLGIIEWFRLYDGIDRVDLGELIYAINN